MDPYIYRLQIVSPLLYTPHEAIPYEDSPQPSIEPHSSQACYLYPLYRRPDKAY